MEKLILSCGRFAPQTGEETEARVRALERYLGDLSEEMELIVARIGQLRVSATEETEEE